MAQTILRLPDVKARTGLSRSTIYLRLAEGSFPRPVSLGARSIGFVEAEIDAWVDERIRARPDIGGKSGRP
jgi:prophage regulatory protein